jgi:hypothetical protein
MLDPNGHTPAILMLQQTTLFCSSETLLTMSRPFVMLTRCPRASTVLSSCIKTQKAIALLPASGELSSSLEQVNPFPDQYLEVCVLVELPEPTSRLASCPKRELSVRQKDCRSMGIAKRKNLLCPRVRQTRLYGRPLLESTSERMCIALDSDADMVRPEDAHRQFRRQGRDGQEEQERVS